MIKINTVEITSEYIINRLGNIDEVCQNYGLYAKFMKFENPESVLGSGVYIVVCTEPIKDDINPYKIVNRNKRNPNLFYPYDFAVRLTEENGVVVFDEVMEYCQNAEFLSRLYVEYNAKLPECIRYSELTGLKNWCDGRNNSDANDKFRNSCKKGLKTFFKNEKSSWGQEKRKYFRSERFAIESNWLQRQFDYSKRNRSIVRLEVLLRSTEEIGIKKIGAHELERLLKKLQTLNPEILVSVSKKDVVDNGLIGLSKKLSEGHPLLQQRPITDEEFDMIIEQRFAKEGFDCIKDVKTAHWEFYDIYYKKVDEPFIIAAFNEIYFAFADHDPLQTIKARGDVNIVTIPVDDFHYFVALAKSKKLQFYIDNYGRLSVPSFTDIHVVYSKWDQSIVNEIINDMVCNTISNSHIF